MGIRRLFRLTALFSTLAALAAVLAPATASATIEETRRLEIVVIYCDDEAETFSDEVLLFVGGNLFGTRSNMDGGDWWDIRRGGNFNDAIYIELWENDGWQIGGHWASVSDAGRGEIEITWRGHHGTGYQYRMRYRVD